MDLLLLSLSHHTASVDVRARVAAAISDVPGWLGGVGSSHAVSELLVLSTCHRLELYAAAENLEAARVELTAWMTGRHEDWGADQLVEKSGVLAARHLCRVASGLESLIVGEAEIAGQVRRAAALAREAGSLGPYLERIVAGALAASGRARSETRIAEGVFSAASAGVALANRALGSLSDRRVLVLGAGEAGRSVLARLRRKPVGSITVASRSVRHATEVAEAIGADVWTLDEVPTRLGEVDAVIAAMPAERWVVTAESVRAAVAAAGRPHVFVDLSMPRIVEPVVAELPGVEVFSVDDLGDIARRSLRRREREIPAVEAIADAEASRAYGHLQARRRYQAGLSPRR